MWGRLWPSPHYPEKKGGGLNDGWLNKVWWLVQILALWRAGDGDLSEPAQFIWCGGYGGVKIVRWWLFFIDILKSEELVFMLEVIVWKMLSAYMTSF